MPPNLKKRIERLREKEWGSYREDSDAIRECAHVRNYFPEDEDRPEGAGVPRYIAILVRKRQGQLLADGNEVKYFVVASNQWDWDAVRLLNVLTALKRLARPEKWLTARRLKD